MTKLSLINGLSTQGGLSVDDSLQLWCCVVGNGMV